MRAPVLRNFARMDVRILCNALFMPRTRFAIRSLARTSAANLRFAAAAAFAAQKGFAALARLQRHPLPPALARHDAEAELALDGKLALDG